jgi:PAS domain S-box-containing protein
VERFSTISRDITERKQAEANRERLAQFERLAQLMKCANDIVLLSDQRGRILEANDRALETYGYSLAELRQKTAEDLRAPESRAELPHQAEQLETDGRAVFETMHQRRDGVAFPVEISARFLEIAGVRCRLGIIRDITKRKRAQEALRRSETELQTILESIADGILAVDDHGKVIHANRRFAELWQIPPALLEAGDDRALLEFVLDQLCDPDAFLKKVQSLYHSDAVEMETLAFKDGHVFERFSEPMMMEGAIKGRVWSFRNITERKRAEEELSHARDQWEDTFNSITDMITVHDKDCNIIQANKAARQILGLPLSGNKFGAKCFRHYHGTESPPAGCPSCPCLTTGLASSYELFESHLNRYLEILAIPRFDRNRQLIGLIHVARDITERKQAEKRVRTFSQEIIVAREEERKKVASVLHHDVGSLAVGISAHLDVIEKNIRSGKPGEALKLLRRTRKLFYESVARLKGLAVELRPPELDVLGLCAALRQYFSLAPKRSGTRIRFKENLGPRRVPGDSATILFRVAQEALTNAIMHGEAKQVNVDLRAAKEELTLTVHDNGSGFNPSEQMARQTSQMGLRVMRETVLFAGGDFTIDSGRGKGTTLRVRLPIADRGLRNAECGLKEMTT